MIKYCSHCMAKLEETSEKCPYCGKNLSDPIPAHHLLPGTVLNNKFYVGEVLGEGGFGITYIGRDINLDLKVAIKEFYPNGYVNRNNTVSSAINDSVSKDNNEFFKNGRENFLREAQILAKFSGEPGIVEVRDYFEENNTGYIIMEFLDGTDLKTYLKEKGKLSPEDTLKLLMPVINSLEKIHTQGLIHRDISPDNIMLIDDKVKLLDFGAARNVTGEENKSMSVMIKPGYAPEEQYSRKGKQGPWTDIYALCATMYKCITGITPDDAAQRSLCDEIKAPSALNIAIKPNIENAIMKGMSVHQSDRYQCIEDLKKDLQKEDVQMDDRTYKIDNNHSQTPPPYAPPAQTPPPYTPPVPTPPPYPEYNEMPPEPIKQNDSNNKKLKIGLIAAVAVIVVLIISFILFMVIPESDKTEEEDTSAVQTEELNPMVNTNLTMTDNLYDFIFTLEGVIYKLPCRYEDLTSQGWTISSSGTNSETKIRGNDYESFRMSKDGKSITVSAYNASGNARAIKDCKIGGIECEADVELILAKGITIHSSKEEIKEAYGVPKDTYSGDDYETLKYSENEDFQYNKVTFNLYDNIKYSEIELVNVSKSVDDKTSSNTERPAYLDEYKAPSSMGSDLKSAVVEIDGILYQFPVPVSEFLKNGWEIAEQPNKVVAGRRDSISIEKNGKQLSLGIINYSEYQTTVENCAVYSIEVDSESFEKVSFGAKNNPTKAVDDKVLIDSAVSDDFNRDESSSFYSYYYSDHGNRNFTMYISVDKKTNKVYTIKLECDTWNY